MRYKCGRLVCVFQKCAVVLPTKCSFFVKISSKILPASEQPERKEGEIDPKFWEILISSDKKDYESICAEFGVTDFRWMLKTLNEMKKEREEEQAEVGIVIIEK